VEVIDPRQFLSGGMFREKDFREAVKTFDWSKFQGKPALIQGCGSVPFPIWAYLVIAAQARRGVVIARSGATKQSIMTDCFASLAMTE